MYKIGNCVVHSTNGICRIVDITMMDVGKLQKLYYVLIPIGDSTSKVFVPVEIAETRLRPAISKEKAMNLIKSIKSIEPFCLKNEKEREKTYKEVINRGNPKQLISMLKTIYIRNQDRLKEGKKVTAVDEQYFRMAEDQLYDELAFALAVKKEELPHIIEQYIK